MLRAVHSAQHSAVHHSFLRSLSFRTMMLARSTRVLSLRTRAMSRMGRKERAESGSEVSRACWLFRPLPLYVLVALTGSMRSSP